MIEGRQSRDQDCRTQLLEHLLVRLNCTRTPSTYTAHFPGTIDRGVTMDIRTFAELTTPDERSLSFTPLGLAPRGLSPENAAEFQQRFIAAADLVPTVPDGTRSSFERLRTLHAYGVLCYDLFTVVDDLTLIVLEQALRERF
ncbi:MAG TPA: hypothetical protein VKB35_16240, partial [Ktedonobacteraceae bacterium]|nr:hypothetical protein [Ktedonobacteraceae bacterium]